MGQFGASDLVMTLDLPYSQVIRHKIDNVPVSWAGTVVSLQVRLRDGTLIGLLDPFLSIDPDDSTRLLLEVPTIMVNALGRYKEGVWDILATPSSGKPFRAPVHPGRVIVLGGVTRAV